MRDHYTLPFRLTCSPSHSALVGSEDRALFLSPEDPVPSSAAVTLSFPLIYPVDPAVWSLYHRQRNRWMHILNGNTSTARQTVGRPPGEARLQQELHLGGYATVYWMADPEGVGGWVQGQGVRHSDRAGVAGTIGQGGGCRGYAIVRCGW